MSSPSVKGPSDELRLEGSRFNRLAKKLAPTLSRVATFGSALRLVRYAEVYLNVLIGKGSGTGWDLEGEVIAACSAIRANEPIVWDVGANQGDWSRLFLERFPKARIVMFEPAVGCHPHLQPMVNERVTLVPFAAGASPGTAQLWSSSSSDGAASLHRRKDTYFSNLEFHPQSVEVTTLDKYLESSGVDRVDFVKLDIEGHELAALQGAEAALTTGKIAALAFEFGAANLNSRTFFRDIWDYLNTKQYDFFRIIPGGRLLPVHSYTEDLEYFRGVTNYLCVRSNLV